MEDPWEPNKVSSLGFRVSRRENVKTWRP